MSSVIATTVADNLAPVIDGRFSYGSNNGFQFDNISRISPAALQELFKPIRRRPLAETRGYKMTKKEIVAQCRLYGVSSGVQSMRVSEMRDMFAEMVKEGELNAPTAEVVQLEASLREKYDALNIPHLTSISRTKQAKFDAITDPTEAAKFSVPLFLQRYFLNVDGVPNRKKKPDPIALPGFGNRAEMHSAAEKIPGLHTCSAGSEPYRVLAIGWDRSAVNSAAGKAAALGHQQHVAEMDEERAMRMDEHREFLETLKDNKKGTKKTAKKGFHMSHATGRYLVECQDIEEEWPAEDGLYMTIVLDEENQGRMVAEFDFGVLMGIMRFRQAGEEPLPSRDLRGSTDEDSEGEGDTGEESEEEVPSEKENHSGKRKRGTAKSQPTPHQPQAKKQKPLPSPTSGTKMKFLFQWRGRETGENEIQLDYGGSNKGYIEFENLNCTTFTGLMDSPYFTKAKLRGYKVAMDDGQGINTAWEDYSERVYEAERVGRWR